MTKQPFLILCIGVSGSGKSTLAQKLARHLHAEFLEADDFHSIENKAHMAAGKPLNDAMREPWINDMCEHIKALGTEHKNCVLAYSGLRRAHRERFRHLGFNVLIILLEGSKALIAKRLQSRKAHFATSALLDSQFEAFEVPLNEPDIKVIRIDQPVSLILTEAKALANEFVSRN